MVAQFYICEFCGCRTNAHLRQCCTKGWLKDGGKEENIKLGPNFILTDNRKVTVTKKTPKEIFDIFIDELKRQTYVRDKKVDIEGNVIEDNIGEIMFPSIKCISQILKDIKQRFYLK